MKNLYPRFTDNRDVSATLNMTFLEHPFVELVVIRSYRFAHVVNWRYYSFRFSNAKDAQKWMDEL